MDFSLDVDYKGSVPVIRVTGGVDIYTAQDLDVRLQHLISEGNTHLCLDLASCSYFDSDGLKVLLRAARLIAGRGQIYVSGASRIISKVFTITGLDEMFPLIESADDLMVTGSTF